VSTCNTELGVKFVQATVSLKVQLYFSLLQTYLTLKYCDKCHYSRLFFDKTIVDILSVVSEPQTEH
jgi:hypothetical protein